MVGSLAMSVPSHAAKYTFTFATHATPDSYRGSVEAGYLKEVERLTDGAVTFKIFWGSSYMQGNEILKGVQDGTVDSGIVNINFFPTQLLFSNALNTIQESIGSFAAVLRFFNRVYGELPELKAEFAKYDNEILSIYGVMNYTLVSTKPITSIRDIKGLKARSASRWQLPLFVELGAKPVSVSWNDCPMALQTNVIDAVFSNMDSINMVRMEDVAPNVIIFKEFLNTVPYVLTMNAKKFKALPQDIQTKFAEAGKTVQSKLVDEYDRWYTIIRANQDKGKYKITMATAEDMNIWKSLPGVEANKRQWVEEATKGGAKDAQKFLDAVYRIFEESKAGK
jgi:TRAP-type C4-dicarboxylate transport system substrate-binding protein